MRARKIAISISNEALETVDRYAKAEGISRSAWFERAAQRAKRQQAVAEAVRQAHAAGLKPSTDIELESLRRELLKAS